MAYYWHRGAAFALLKLSGQEMQKIHMKKGHTGISLLLNHDRSHHHATHGRCELPSPNMLTSPYHRLCLHLFKGLKATNEQQDDEPGVFHQVHNTLHNSYMDRLYKATMPLSANVRPGEIGQCDPLNTPPLAQRGSGNMWAVNNYQSLSGALNIWNVSHHATMSPCPQNVIREMSDIQLPN